jgi:hypothetical protein
VRLRLLTVLYPANGDQRSVRKAIVDQGHRIGDREGVAVEKHYEIVVRRLVADLHSEVIELGGVQAALLYDSVEVDGV